MSDVAAENLEQFSTVKRQDSQEDKYCWVCFATDEDEDDLSVQWVQPCKCRGTTRWVHDSCLQRWVDEKQKGNATERVSCPQCNTEYIIVFPPMGKLVLILDLVDQVVYRVCPFVAAGILIGSIYWTAVTYGALTIMQVIGPKEGLAVMEQADPLFLLVGLPTIPILLVLGRLIRWEDALLIILRKAIPRFPLSKYLLPSFHSPVNPSYHQGIEIPPLSDPVSATRILCGALVFPSMAVLVGKLIFHPVNCNFQRALLGGLTFLALKGALKIYHKQQTYIRQCKRKVKDFTLGVSSSVNRRGGN